jgi:hypothetical protein
MASPDPEIVRANPSEFVTQTLPDGSTALFEVATRNVYSLNASAAAAWQECATATSLPALAAGMSRRLNAPVTVELAQAAVSELAAAGLVRVSEPELRTSRRTMLRQVAGVALPVVLVLTGAEQRVHAQTQSPPPTTPPPGTTQPPGTTFPPGTTGPPLLLEIFKSFQEDENSPRLPLEGAEFDVKNLQGQVVAHLVTDANGKASTMLPAGTYTVHETFAPPSLDAYVPFSVKTVQLIPPIGAIRNYNNLMVQE